MKILRLAWSGYQSDSSLHREQSTIRDAGYDYERAPEPGELPNNPSQYDVIVVNSQFPVDEDVLRRWDRDGTVIVASSGYDRVDVEACERHGVTVVRTPEARAGRVGDHTLMMARALLRDLPNSNHQLRNGEWDRPGAFRRINRLSSLTVGVLGVGVIGRRIIERIREEDPYELVAWDPQKRGTIERMDGVQCMPLPELLSSTNLLTIHASLNEDSRNLIGKPELSQLREPSYLINTARGEIINYEDLQRLLESGRLQGAAIDVFPSEPFEPDDPLPDNLLTTPHTAGFGPGLLSDLTEEILDVLRALNDDRTLPHVVTDPPS